MDLTMGDVEIFSWNLLSVDHFPGFPGLFSAFELAFPAVAFCGVFMPPTFISHRLIFPADTLDTLTWTLTFERFSNIFSASMSTMKRVQRSARSMVNSGRRTESVGWDGAACTWRKFGHSTTGRKRPKTIAQSAERISHSSRSDHEQERAKRRALRFVRLAHILPSLI